MANIAITTICNLKCPYCFANTMIQENEISQISLEQFQKTLDWLSSTKTRIGLIGGEPTLHSDFDEILKMTDAYCTKFDCHATLFTNGIELGKFIPYLTNHIGVLLNVNAPDNMTQEQWNKLMVTLDALKYAKKLGKVVFGCNIYRGRENYDYIFDLCKKYKKNFLRFSMTAPTPNTIITKDKYYSSMKDIYFNFIKKAHDNGITLKSDCSQIPDCYFTEEELKIIYATTTGRHMTLCKPVVDITPDFYATSCFGSYDPVDCSKFNNLEELKQYFIYRKNYPRFLNNGSGKCANCEKYELAQCQGGCLGFAGQE